MPFDSTGKHHLNTQKAMYADKQAASATASKAPDSMEKDSKDESSDRVHTIHDHGDGSYHVEDADGDRTDHADAQSLKGHMDALFGDGTSQETAHDDKDAAEPDSDDKPSYRMLGGL